MKKRRPHALVATAVATASFLAGCGQASSTGDETPRAFLDTSVPDISVVEVYCFADYPWYRDTAELVSRADAVIRGTAPGPSRDYEIRPQPPTDDPDPAVDPQHGVTQQEVDELPGVAASAITVRVTQVFTGDLAVGDVIEVNQGTCSERPLPTGSGTDYVLALRGGDGEGPWGQLNEDQAAWQVDATGGLHAVSPANDLDVSTVDDLAVAAATATP